MPAEPVLAPPALRRPAATLAAGSVPRAPSAWSGPDSGWHESSWELRQGLWVGEADEEAWQQACGALGAGSPGPGGHLVGVTYRSTSAASSR